MHAIFVEAVAQPGAAEPGVLVAIAGQQLLLGSDALQREHRVGVVVHGMDALGPDTGCLVQADTPGLAALQALQDVHVVAQRRQRAGAAAQAHVPAGPGAPVAGQHTLVMVQHHFIAGIGDGAQQRPLLRRGVLQQCQRLIAVAGEDHFVEEILASGTAHAHLFAALVQHPAAHAQHRGIEPNLLAVRRRQRWDVTVGAPLDHPPLRAILQVQQAVIAEEAHEELQRKGLHGGVIGRPDGRAHGNQIPLQELLAVAKAAQVVAQGGCPQRGVVGQVFFHLAVEAQDVAHHPQKARRQQIAPLCEQGVQIGAGVFDPAPGIGHAEAHRRVAAAHAQGVQQGDEVRVGAVIEDNEAGVDGQLLTLVIHLDGGRVSAQAGV